MSKVIVTGGSGFIGSNLVDKLVLEGHQVFCIDDESSTSGDKFYWNDLASNHKLNILDRKNVLPLFEGAEVVFHVAARPRVQISIEDPCSAFTSNSYATFMALEYSRINNVRRFVYSSTSSIYGSNSVPNHEMQPEDCMSPYSTSKLCGEKACHSYSRNYAMESVILRYFNVFGPRSPEFGPYAPIVGKFSRMKSLGLPLTIFGEGTQRRDLTHVQDVVEANMLSAFSNLSDYEIGTPINIGSGCNYSVLEVAHMFSDELKFMPARPCESKETLADNSKALKVLGWKPRIGLNEYIKSLVP